MEPASGAIEVREMRRVSSLTGSPAGSRLSATAEVIFIVVFRPEPDYVLWRQFFPSFRPARVCRYGTCRTASAGS